MSIFDRPPADYEDESKEPVWDLSDHSGAPAPVKRAPRPAPSPAPLPARAPAPRVAYRDSKNDKDFDDQQTRKEFLAIALGGAVVGVILTLLISSLMSFHGVLAKGITPMDPNVAFRSLTPDIVRNDVTQINYFFSPCVMSDLTMFVEHGEASDNLTDAVLICNIYEDSARQQVYGVEFSVDASSRAVEGETKIEDAAQRLFHEAVQLTGSYLDADHAERWAQIALRKSQRIGAVSRATFGHATLTCYGTPWTRSLLITPR